MATHAKDNEIEKMTGLGPKSAQWLREAGITRASQVRKLGAVECYARVIRLGRVSPNLNLLWALQGAIEDLHWTMIDPNQRMRLQAQVDQRLKSNTTA